MQSTTKADEPTNLVLTQRTWGSICVHHIKASQNAKLLGILLDSKLNWTAQHERVCEKVVKWMAALRRFTKPSTGIRMKEAVKLYNTVTVPKICYAADIWFTPSWSFKADSYHTGPVGITRHLKSVQRQVAISITGAMRTALGDTAIVHANITPIGLQLREFSAKAYLCLASQPSSHPVSKFIARTHKLQVTRHWTALYHLAKVTNIDPNALETVRP